MSQPTTLRHCRALLDDLGLITRNHRYRARGDLIDLELAGFECDGLTFTRNNWMWQYDVCLGITK